MRSKKTIAGVTLAACVLLVMSCSTGARQPPLILLVTVDTLRADRLGAYGSTLGLTPNFDRLAADSQVFTAAFAPASSTLPSIAALMTSRYPEEVGITSNGAVVSTRAPRLARVLYERGWATGAVVSNYVLRRKAQLTRGFEIYDARLTEPEGNRGVRERRGPDTTRDALRTLDLLRSPSRPVFLWVHYQDPHGPYVPPDAQRARTLAHERARPDGPRQLSLSPSLSGEGALPRYQEVGGQREVAFYRAGYNGEVAVVDEEIGRLLDGLRSRGLLADAVIVFTADHGESLGEDDYWFAHGERVGEVLVRVPLLVRVPGRPAQRRSDLASLLDVFPTLVAFAGGDRPPGLRGRDLFSSAPPPRAVYFSTLDTAAVPRRGVTDGALHYVRWDDGEGAHEQVSRLAAADPARAVPESSAAPALRGQLAQARASLATLDGGSAPVVTPEEADRLGALGYVAR